MVSWAEFSTAEPELAQYGWELLREDQGYAYLATVTRAGDPRVHPVVPFLIDGRLLVSVDASSPKASDLRAHASYMLHATVGDNDTEFAVRGRAIETTAGEVQEGHALFELDIDRVDAAIWEDGPARRQIWRP